MKACKAAWCGRITEFSANLRARLAHMALPFPPQDKRDEPKKALTIDPQFLAARRALKWGEPKKAVTIQERPYPGLDASIAEIGTSTGKTGQSATQGKRRGAPSKAPDIVRANTELLQSGDLSPDSGKRARNAAIRKKLKQLQLRATTIERALKDQ